METNIPFRSAVPVLVSKGSDSVSVKENLPYRRDRYNKFKGRGLMDVLVFLLTEG